MLTVAWNATVWGGVFGWMAREWSIQGGFGLVKGAGLTSLIFVPHLSLEALAYSLSGMAGVFVGRALLKFTLAQAVPWRSFRNSIIHMVLLAFIALLLAALFEAHIAPMIGEVIQRQLL